jgi:membrane-associated phospholipid phosphatase
MFQRTSRGTLRLTMPAPAAMRDASTIACAFLLAAAIALPASGASPYETSWSKDGWVAGLSVAAGICAIVVSQTSSPLTVAEINALSRESVNRFDRSATYRYSEDIADASDVLIYAVVAAPFVLLAGERVQDDWETFSLMYAEVIALAAILPAFGKGTVERPRPYTYNPDVPMDYKTTSDAKKSFFSRHTSMAFASAVFLSTAYDDYYPDSRSSPYVWVGSLLAASAVGYMRYASGEHFPTDIITGAVVGSAVGYLIPLLHRADHGNLSLAAPATAGSPVGLVGLTGLTGLAFELRW